MLAKHALRVAPILLLAGCPQEVEVWVAPGVRADSVTIYFGSEVGEVSHRSIGLIKVLNCLRTGKPVASDTIFWKVLSPGAGTRLDSAKYGQEIAGIPTVVPAKPLRKGCFQVVTDENSSEFLIGEDGRTVTSAQAISKFKAEDAPR